jgi:hypothetical protein
MADLTLQTHKGNKRIIKRQVAITSDNLKPELKIATIVLMQLTLNDVYSL